MKIKVYSGMSVEHKCGSQRHPLTETMFAKDIIDGVHEVATIYSNSPDFISTLKYYGEMKNVEIEFFLNDVSFGNNIEPLFEDFNLSLDYQNKICQK